MKRIKEIVRFLKIAEQWEGNATINKEDVPIVLKVLNEYIRFHDVCFLPEYEKLFAEVEKALGFKLFIWQKTFIAMGRFRCFGKTTAEILAELLRTDDKPIDFSLRARNLREDCRRDQYRKIQLQLQDAGIPTRIIFWSKREKERYLRSMPINRNWKEETKQRTKPPLWIFEDLEQEGKK